MSNITKSTKVPCNEWHKCGECGWITLTIDEDGEMCDECCQRMGMDTF